MPRIDPIFDSLFDSQRQLEKFRKSLVDWFTRDGRDYPWRRTSDPYRILVSELMLQQTRIETVLKRGYFQRWIDRFPDTVSLAAAEEAEILKLWEGLGYYNRARNLQKTAEVVERTFGGHFPRTLDEVLGLPGVGRYTAGAVVSFAFGESAPIVDGNVVRVLSRIFGYAEPVDSTEAKSLFWSWAEKMTPEKKAREYNSGIMELGQRICSRTSPRCEICPVQEHCRAREDGTVGRIPQKSRKTKITERIERVAFIARNGAVFLTRETGSRRKGLWRLPEISEDESADLVERLRFDYAITRYRVNLRVYEANPGILSRIGNEDEGSWFALDAPQNWP
ncbi:MAG: A/G-specific adenine glycosylase, partial [Verrucomicrobiota bacterium]